jgi:hypothetical protein
LTHEIVRALEIGFSSEITRPRYFPAQSTGKLERLNDPTLKVLDVTLNLGSTKTFTVVVSVELTLIVQGLIKPTAAPMFGLIE